MPAAGRSADPAATIAAGPRPGARPGSVATRAPRPARASPQASRRSTRRRPAIRPSRVATGRCRPSICCSPSSGESMQQAAASEPATAESKSAPSPTLPVGIPGFAPAIADKVANGRKPALEGLDWLKANGYRGALLVRKPGENDAADRRQFEVRGLNFASLEVTLTNLDRSGGTIQPRCHQRRPATALRLRCGRLADRPALVPVLSPRRTSR